MVHRVLVVFLSLWSSGLWTGDTHSPTVHGEVRLVGGDSRCAGHLEQKHQGDWDPVDQHLYDWNLTSAAAVCRLLDCGSLISLRRTEGSSVTVLSNIEQLVKMVSHQSSPPRLEINCSVSIRLVRESSLCSGRLEVNSDPSKPSWSSVCKDNFDQQEAEVVCRELGCGPPSVHHGELLEEGETPAWTKEFQCGGHESALLDCGSSNRETCSSGTAVRLTCSERDHIRLVGGGSRCSGTLEMNREGEWKSVDQRVWNLSLAGTVCGQLGCGSAVSTKKRRTLEPAYRFTWTNESGCEASWLEKCLPRQTFSSSILEITCSDSVRLMNGTDLCSGRLEVKSDQSWSSVCEADFGLENAEVVCRELSCGPPSVFKGGLYGEGERPVLVRKFRCDGYESALLDCGSSWTGRTTCSPGKAVGLTCSDPNDIRLVQGASRCTGQLQLKHHYSWKAVNSLDFNWNLKASAVICRWLDCGSAVAWGKRRDSSKRSVWWVSSVCVQSNATLHQCVTASSDPSSSSLEITCSEFVRLVNGSSLCSGRLEVKSDHHSWSPVCEDNFDQQDAEVVCRELNCGPPAVLQGELYGEWEAAGWTKEFRCEGHESALWYCGSLIRNTSSSGRAVRLTCSDPDIIRLSGGNSTCGGSLELKKEGEWRPVALWNWDSDWVQKTAAVVCRVLDCGSAISGKITEHPDRLVWWIKPSCVHIVSSLLDCVMLTNNEEFYSGLEVICSDLLPRPNVSFSPSTDGVSMAEQQGLQVLLGSSFTITCSVAPLYPGGSFELIFTVSSTSKSYALPADNHSAHFLFFAAGRAHQGGYTCVYHLYVFSYNFSSESQPLYISVSASLTELMIRLVVLLLGLLSLITVLCVHTKVQCGISFTSALTVIYSLRREQLVFCHVFPVRRNPR
uniref:scavenger receptor cysteine-rich type 1 protein M130-like n=1 Tax=Scatophagus argus TaxID=75038 RepID=UPI001ED7D7FC|nr:scavenger receptor cysteine-rich type 1 protein M130-like [Scatophagus argus]